MMLEKDLEKRTWPIKPDYPVEKYSTTIKNGFMINRVLRIHQSLSEPIPPGECAITSLCLGDNGKIYGATTGKKSHLFYYDPGPEADGVCDIGVIERTTSVKKSLVAGKNGIIYGGISEGNGEGYIFAYNTKNDRMSEGKTDCGTIEKLLVPVTGEYICSLIIDSARNLIYGITGKTGTLFSFDIEHKKVNLICQIDKNGLFSETLVLDDKGNVYCCGAFGHLYKYSILDNKFTKLSVSIPTITGRDLYNKLDSAVFNKYDRLIYGGGSGDGVLFSFNPETNFIKTIGKVTSETGIPAMTAGNDGIIYGISGEKEGMAHLFSYDPDTSSLVELGMPSAATENFWHGYEFSSACTGVNGEIYLGESDRISHLFIYFPPIPVKKKIIQP
ncbi:MAG: hypothetical protein M1501_00615 [Candidatus Omnitrophica bacterium]|nr:hypothetical protein [Candidatus Omnitrophota bacterium]